VSYQNTDPGTPPVGTIGRSKQRLCLSV
jgi:hypothetical protein